ncbi:MAG: PH domain-containing protein [Candidatus Nanohaloarchaea archaeon]
MTEYDWLSLDRGEEIEWSGEPRIHSIIPAILFGIPMIPVFGVGLLIIAGAYLNIKNTDYVVTNKGLYEKTGVLSRRVQNIGFDKIQDISFSQGVFGNYFGYGEVSISTAGSSGDEMGFSNIENPKEVQELVNRMRSAGKQSLSSCPNCGHDIEDEWMACPECGHRMRDRCDNCSKLLDPEWNVCPYCRKKVGDD